MILLARAYPDVVVFRIPKAFFHELVFEHCQKRLHLVKGVELVGIFQMRFPILSEIIDAIGKAFAEQIKI